MGFQDYAGNEFTGRIVWPNEGICHRQGRAMADNLRLLRNSALARLPGEWRHTDMTEMVHESGHVFWAWRRLWPGRAGCPLVDHRAYAGAAGARFSDNGFPNLMAWVQVWGVRTAEGQDWRDLMPGGADDGLAFSAPASEALAYFGKATASPHAGKMYTREIRVAETTLLLYSPAYGEAPGRLMVDREDSVSGDLVAVFRIETSPPIPSKTNL